MFCKNCGAPLTPEKRFCSRCGTAVEAEASGYTGSEGGSDTGGCCTKRTGCIESRTGFIVCTTSSTGSTKWTADSRCTTCNQSGTGSTERTADNGRTTCNQFGTGSTKWTANIRCTVYAKCTICTEFTNTAADDVAGVAELAELAKCTEYKRYKGCFSQYFRRSSADAGER